MSADRPMPRERNPESTTNDRYQPPRTVREVRVWECKPCGTVVEQGKACACGRQLLLG